MTALKPFVFVIPIRNPLDAKVKDYETVQAVFRKTVKSVLSPTVTNIRLVVVMHGSPGESVLVDSRVTAIDVTDSIFDVNPPVVEIDKGLRYLIGTLYAFQAFQPRHVMLMDCDDFINTDLVASISAADAHEPPGVDGFSLVNGLNVELDITVNQDVRFNRAFVIDRFNCSCGSCRIFRADRLRAKIEEALPGAFSRFTTWQSAQDGGNCIPVPRDAATWLHELVRSSPSAFEFTHLLGDHLRQEPAFALQPISILGAAKGCGHGNHDGPRRGAIHFDKITREMPIEEFLVQFGLSSRTT